VVKKILAEYQTIRDSMKVLPDNDEVFSTPEALRDFDKVIRNLSNNKDVQNTTTLASLGSYEQFLKTITPQVGQISRTITENNGVMIENALASNDLGDAFQLLGKRAVETLPIFEESAEALQNTGESLGFIGEQAEESGEFLNLFAQSPAPREFSNNWSTGYTNFMASSKSATRTATTAFRNFAGGARSAISNSLFSLLRGDMKSFGNIWKRFAGSLLDTFTNTFTKLASNSIFGLFGLGSGGGGLESLLSGGVKTPALVV
jgi:hypothetical protein